MTESTFSLLSEDIILQIFIKLEEDPQNWARLASVCTRFSSLIILCYKKKCSQSIPSIISDLLSGGPHYPAPSDPPGGWAALHKLSVCCPGLLHAGVLLENSDFGLEREIGPDLNYLQTLTLTVSQPSSSTPPNPNPNSDPNWSLFDDLYFDTVYDFSESHNPIEGVESVAVKLGTDLSVGKKRRKICRSVQSHLASRVWNLSREQGNKLLASRFRGDCLYICDWPGCVHTQEKRNYMLFRGVFKNFKRSRVWRTINDGNRSKIGLDCAFCSCKETWDLHSAFCLRRVFGYHDDGEPVVRAYVCENGHVSGAWTDRPMYT
ncbi:F-box family protein [Tasmannia lanceolata]|uniref:F-box family protein n=1 Tax=Tasmannia lanceolata TaxID=3420 RepID=UPI0040641B4A